MQTTVEKWVKVIIDGQRPEKSAIRLCPLDRYFAGLASWVNLALPSSRKGRMTGLAMRIPLVLSRA
jgi:hypothetical protein